MSKIDENELAKYSESVESAAEAISPKEVSVSDLTVGNGDNIAKLREKAAEKAAVVNTVSAEQEHEGKVRELQQHNRDRGVGFLGIKMEDLPTKGMFYPEGTRVYVKSATLGDIKHWSAVDETDLSAIDDAINEILDSCCSVVFPDTDTRYADWKDLCEIDRMYLLMAIHDFTFPNGKNDIKVPIHETKDVVLKKDNVEYIKLSDKIMKYYDADNRCFTFPVKNTSMFPEGVMRVYMPKVGVVRWVKDYVSTRAQRQEGYDKDFVGYAPFLIPDHRGLSNDKYYSYIDSTVGWTAYEWSLISKVKQVIETSITPVLKYKDENGAMREAPLNFRGGFKRLFQQDLEIDL